MKQWKIWRGLGGTRPGLPFLTDIRRQLLQIIPPSWIDGLMARCQPNRRESAAALPSVSETLAENHKPWKNI